MQKIELTWLEPNQTIEIGSDAEITGLFVGRGDEKIKSQLVFKHVAAGITSRINIKAVVFDNSKFDIEAMVAIPDGASKTDTFLKIDCLIMSESASARAVPSLEIQEDEVKGGHGATVGMVDPAQIHYLMSRGLARPEAEAVLVEAFIAG